MRPNLRRWVGAEGREERRHSNRVVQRKRKELFRESRNSAIETQIFTGREGKREKEGGSGREGDRGRGGGGRDREGASERKIEWNRNIDRKMEWSEGGR